MHLTIDGSGGRADYLADAKRVEALLTDLPRLMGMTVIYGPAVIEYVAETPEDSGVSGFVMIAESHISVHTYPARGIVWADAFSCKSFDVEMVIDALWKAFALSDVQTRTIARGLEYEEIPV